MHDYNTIFLVECQDKNGSLFHFVSFAQIQSIIYSRLTSKKISFICAFFSRCFQTRLLRRKQCEKFLFSYKTIPLRIHCCEYSPLILSLSVFSWQNVHQNALFISPFCHYYILSASGSQQFCKILLHIRLQCQKMSPSSSCSLQK